MKAFISGLVIWFISASIIFGIFSYSVLENLSLPAWIELEITITFVFAIILGVSLSKLVENKNSPNLWKIILFIVITPIVYFLTGDLYTMYS